MKMKGEEEVFCQITYWRSFAFLLKKFCVMTVRCCMWPAIQAKEACQWDKYWLGYNDAAMLTHIIDRKNKRPNKKGSVFAAALHIFVILKNFSWIFFGSTTMEGGEIVFSQFTKSWLKELLHFLLRCDDGKLHIECDQQSKLKKRANGINIDWDITMLPCSHTHNWPKIKRVRYLLPFCIFLSYSKTFLGFFWKYNNGRGRGSVWPNHAVINNKLCARGVTNKILLNRQEHPFLLYTTQLKVF